VVEDALTSAVPTLGDELTTVAIRWVRIGTRIGLKKSNRRMTLVALAAFSRATRHKENQMSALRTSRKLPRLKGSLRRQRLPCGAR